jgi:hypothetical protein
MKTQGTDMSRESASSETQDEAPNVVIAPAADREAVAVLAYFYWEARGCPHDSSHEDWFRAEAELRNRLAASAMA